MHTDKIQEVMRQVKQVIRRSHGREATGNAVEDLTKAGTTSLMRLRLCLCVWEKKIHTFKNQAGFTEAWHAYSTLKLISPRDDDECISQRECQVYSVHSTDTLFVMHLW